MGIAIRNLHATNVGDESGYILVSSWIPIKKKDGYHRPPETPIGLDIWLPNVLDLKPEEGTVDVIVVPSDVETGIWLYCFDDYFGNEQHLCNYKPAFIDGTKRPDPKPYDENEDAWSIHIWCDIEMVAGDGPIPVTLERGKYPKDNYELDYYKKPQKQKLWVKLRNFFKKR